MNSQLLANPMFNPWGKSSSLNSSAKIVEVQAVETPLAGHLTCANLSMASTVKQRQGSPLLLPKFRMLFK
jgi:hypothetical protein